MVTRLPEQADVDRARAEVATLPDGPDKDRQTAQVESMQQWVNEHPPGTPPYDPTED